MEIRANGPFRRFGSTTVEGASKTTDRMFAGRRRPSHGARRERGCGRFGIACARARWRVPTRTLRVPLSPYLESLIKVIRGHMIKILQQSIKFFLDICVITRAPVS